VFNKIPAPNGQPSQGSNVPWHHLCDTGCGALELKVLEGTYGPTYLFSPNKRPWVFWSNPKLMIFVDDVDVNNTPKIKIDMHVKVVKIIDGFIQMILAFSSFRVFFSSFQLFIFRKSQMIGFMGFLKRHIFLVI